VDYLPGGGKRQKEGERLLKKKKGGVLRKSISVPLTE